MYLIEIWTLGFIPVASRKPDKQYRVATIMEADRLLYRLAKIARVHNLETTPKYKHLFFRKHYELEYGINWIAEGQVLVTTLPDLTNLDNQEFNIFTILKK